MVGAPLACWRRDVQLLYLGSLPVIMYWAPPFPHATRLCSLAPLSRWQLALSLAVFFPFSSLTSCPSWLFFFFSPPSAKALPDTSFCYTAIVLT